MSSIKKYLPKKFCKMEKTFPWKLNFLCLTQIESEKTPFNWFPQKLSEINNKKENFDIITNDISKIKNYILDKI